MTETSSALRLSDEDALEPARGFVTGVLWGAAVDVLILALIVIAVVVLR